MTARHFIIAAALLGIVAASPALGNEAKELSDQVQAAMAASNWQAAADALNKLVAIDPRWPNYEALGDVQYNMGKYKEASDAFDQAISGALVDKTMARDKLAAGLGTMYISKGHALEQLAKDDDAVAAYNNAASYLTNPAPAYFAICALQFNDGKDPTKACDDTIAADPTMADAYFVKGSYLMAQVKSGPGQDLVIPPGTAETLQKYLQLAPNGSHVADVNDMLTALKNPK